MRLVPAQEQWGADSNDVAHSACTDGSPGKLIPKGEQTYENGRFARLV